jgi:hypothetical protein
MSPCCIGLLQVPLMRVVPCVLSALAAHPTSPKVTEQCLRLLWNLSALDDNKVGRVVRVHGPMGCGTGDGGW